MVISLSIGGLSSGQSAFQVEVVVESAFTRLLPTTQSAQAASVFIGDRLIAIGRNADGNWFEVQRLRGTRIGWITRQFLDFEFDPIGLPITDGITGLKGPTPVVEQYGVSILILVEVNLRADASTRSATIDVVPHSSILPLLEIYPDLTWVKVNYLGNIGWIAGYLVRLPENLGDVPRTPGVTGVPGFQLVVIPPEIQRAQLQRLREFVISRKRVADDLAGFWALVNRGDIVPCTPPGLLEEQYNATFQDYRELPELRRYLPRIQQAIDYLNASLRVLQPCGTYTQTEVNSAYADAVNAKVIFDATLLALDNLDQNIIPPSGATPIPTATSGTP
jgi:uncharacterized protein YraI